MANGVEIRAPAEQTEGTRSQLLRWLKAVGDPVTQNEPLIELETDKVTVEIAAPGSGVLQEILKQEQEEVAPGELLGRIGLSDGDRDGHGVRVGVAAHGATGGATPGTPASTTGSARVSATPSTPATAVLPSGPAPKASPTAAASADGPATHLLSPAVRRLLTEYSLEASAIRGTGDGGRITVQDVMAAIAKPTGAASAVGVTAGAGQRTRNPKLSEALALTDTSGSVRRVPHSAVRKRIAEHMVRSLLQTAPHVTTVFEVNMAAVLAHRARHRDDFAAKGAPLTMTAYFLQAAVAALRAVPEANSRWTDSDLEIFDSIHIGVATALDDELVVPVIRDVDTLDLLATARALTNLVARARDRKLTPADVRGGTFTISNHGVSGSLIATPIVINQPQSAILGIGKLEKRAVVVEDNDGNERITVEPRCYATLTIDHRVMDGRRANRFLQVFSERLTGWKD